MTNWLILDCNYLCWRSFHSTGHLRDKTGPTGVAYGFFRAVAELQDRFAAHHRTVYCFDHGKSLRYALCPTYKQKRSDDPEKRRQRRIVHKQIERLKTKYLPRLRANNLFYADGYEADDVIAKVVNRLVIRSNTTKMYVVSADKDLFQLLDAGLTHGPRVFVFNPQTKVLHDRDTFQRAFGIHPTKWMMVKALAGCGTDQVPGLPGVGEKTAIKYLVGATPRKGKVASVIHDALLDKKWLRRQVELVAVPFPDCPRFDPVKGTPDPARYNRLMDDLGFKSLKESARG